MTRTLFIILFMILIPVQGSYGNEDIKNSIVKIYTQSIRPYYSDPWTMNSPNSKSGSGCIIYGNRIITNAHVVSDHTLILVRKYGEAKRYKATLEFISHDVDLAILNVDDASFYEGTVPLKLDDLPNTQEEVVVYGYPKGGDTLSITKGVISRIEHERYANSSLSFLASQIDAPINPGNSGGPAIIDGKIVGIIMQTLGSSENIGYMIPTPIIKHFLKDIEDGTYDGFPGLGIVTQDIENEDHKLKYKMNENDTGVLVLYVVPGSASDGIIQEKDILLSVNGNKISGNGTVEFRPKHRTHFAYFIQLAQVGEKINVDILRNGKRKNVNIDLDTPINYNQLVKIEYDVLPKYYIYAGLVFSPLTLNYLKEWGRNWSTRAPRDLISRLKTNYKKKENEEIVMLIRVLASEINQGYHSYENWVINKVNGIEINNLEELIEIVEKNGSQKFVTFENKEGNEIVINTSKAQEFNNTILNIYRINSDRSDNLKMN